MNKVAARKSGPRLLVRVVAFAGFTFGASAETVVISYDSSG